MSDLKSISFESTRSFVRHDAPAKVCGNELYAVDHYGEGLLWAGVKRAGVPHAKLLGVDAGAALGEPGVVAVLTAKDVPGPNRQGVVRADQPVLVDDRVRHCGDAVALVIAETREALASGINAIRLDMDELPGVFDPEAALQPEAPLLHEDHDSGNLLLEGHLVKGRGAAELDSCPIVVEAVWHLPRQEHAYLETENGWACQDADGTIHLVASTQTPHRDCLEVARALSLDPSRIHMRAPYCGGAFGGKDGITVQSLLALAAITCPGLPIKMWWDREESMIAGAKRHPARLHYILGADRDGTLRALKARLVYDTGAYDHLGGVVATLGLEHAGGPYRIPHADLTAQAVYTNNPVGGPFRGFGVTQAAAGMELTMDLLANEIDQDPLDLRRRNLLKPGETTAAGVELAGVQGLHDCLKTVSQHELWTTRKEWKEQAGRNKRRDVGLAVLCHAMGYGPVIPDEAHARLVLLSDGRFSLYSGVVDMGQGNASTFLQIAAQVLGQPVDCFDLAQPDTAETKSSGSSSASRTTYTFGNAILGAAQVLRQRILSQARKLMTAKAAPGELVMIAGAVRHAESETEVSLAQVALALPRDQRDVTHYFRAPVADKPQASDKNIALHGFPHAVYAYAAHLAAVEVDELTGKTELLDYLTVSDCGRVLNPQLLEQQMEGAVVQGMGYAICEDYISCDGYSRTTDFSTYIIPSALDAPRIETLFLAGNDSSSPLGMRGGGEIGINGPLPAVGNAVARASGRPMTRFPLSPERVLAALGQEEQGR